MRDWIYDIETYPNCFTLCAESADSGTHTIYEISDYKDDSRELMVFLNWLVRNKCRMIGFNNVGFDYPMIHQFMKKGGDTCYNLYLKGQAIIDADRGDWSHVVWPRDRFIEQIDLYKIHHFDNKARHTSLKTLEFNMRSEIIEDLPFAPGTLLSKDDIETLRLYNHRDVKETKKFWFLSQQKVKMREELSIKYGRNFMNHSDSKIGKDFFIMKLNENGISTDKQTIRESINLKDAIFNHIKFQDPEFTRVLEFLKSQVITETKGVFKDVTADSYGLDFVFGLGGIHASVDKRVVVAGDDLIIDLDVASYYPNLAIKNRYYPEHLSEAFCDIYEEFFNERKKYKKGSVENMAYKLGLNSVYGDSNNPYSPFYDSLYTMKTTLNGQLLLCILAEWLMLNVNDAELIQVNTDGLTIKLPKSQEGALCKVWHDWEQYTGLTLERADYNRMFIADVNNYIAEYTDGKVKRKGRYEYKDLDWNKNFSALIVPKAVEQHLLHGTEIREFIESHEDIYDFMLRAKVTKKGRLFCGDTQVQNTSRYYISHNGEELYKVLPPLKGKIEERKIGINKGWRVKICNDMKDFESDSNFDWYIKETEKLCEFKG